MLKLKSGGALAMGSLAVAFFLNADPASAAINFSLKSSSPTTGENFTFTSGGVTLQILALPSSPTTPAARSNSNTIGICAFSDLPGCGDTTNPKGQTLTGLSLSFDTPVELISYDITRIRVDPTIPPALIDYTPTWSNGSTTVSFPLVSNFPIGTPVIDNPGTITFAPGLFGTSFTNTTAFTTTDELFEYRISNLIVDRYTASVPAPIPLFGAAAALAWSRKLRNRVRRAG
jgi:hypothetical protein